MCFRNINLKQIGNYAKCDLACVVNVLNKQSTTCDKIVGSIPSWIMSNTLKGYLVIPCLALSKNVRQRKMVVLPVVKLKCDQMEEYV